MPPSSSNDAQARGRAQSGTPPPQLASHQSVHPPASGPPRELPLGAATTTWPTDDGRAEPQSGVGWLNSVSDLGAMAAEGDEVEDRGDFVLEYNRLAKEHGVRIMVMPVNKSAQSASPHELPEKRGWFSRKFFRHSSFTSATTTQTVRGPTHRRSVSDIAMSLIHGRKDPYRYEDLQELVRVCGKSILHLPSEYSPRGLVLPTCFRATAHYLVQHMETRGIFRVSGSMRQVNTIYQYYCDANADGDGGSDVTSTTRCPSLPSHLQCGPHEVATAFKKFLGSLPGGILGSLELFDAMVAIHSQLRQSGHPEGSPRTREGSIRARLIAMAIGTVRSRYRRDLICAVLGLLSLIGSRAEVEIAAAPREDEFGNALPSSDHMGYNALGVVFGPLLVGDLLDSYTMKLATPSAGLVLFPMTPPKLRKLMPGGSGGGSRPLNQQSPKKQSPTPLTVDKVHVANNVAEMLIRHWRDVVRHMKSLGVLKTRAERGVADHQQRQQRHQRPLSGSSFFLRPSQSETGFAMRRPTDWEIKNNLMSLRRHLKAPQESPTPVPRGARLAKIKVSPDQSLDMLNVKRTRPRWSSPGSGRRRGSNRPVVTILSPILSPTLDESAGGVLRSPGTGTVPATGDVVPESNGEVTKDGLVADESTNASTAEAWPLPDGGAGPSVPSSEPRGIGSPRTVDRAIVADDPQQAQESGTLHASAGQGQVHDETSVEATGRNGSLDEAPIVGTLPPDSLTLDGPQERNDDMAAMPGAGTNASEKPRVTTDSHIDVHSLNTRNKGETADEHGSINVETRAARQSVVSETSTGDGEIGAYVPPDRSLRTPARRLSDAPRVSVLSMAARFDTVASPARSIRASHPGLYGVRPSSTQTEFVRTPVPNRRETLVYNNRRSYGSDDGTVLSYATTPDPTPATRDSTILPNPLRPATFAAARAGIPSANWRETPQLNGNSGSPRRYSDWRWSPAGSPSAGAAARLSDSPSPQPSLSPFGTTTSERSRSVAVSTQLHQEIRALRKRLDALVEENGQLRKAAEVRSVCQPAARTVDQKGSKRASVVTAVEVHDPESAAVWRERAERAEARLDAYERFVARVRSIIARPGGYSAVAMAASPDEKRASRLAQSLRLNGTASMGDNRSGSAPSPSSDTATEVDDDEVGSSARRLSSVVEKQGGTGEHEKARKRVNGNGVSIVRPSSSGSTCSNRSVDTIHSNTATASVAEELPLDGRGRGWMTTPARATSATMKNGCIKNDRRRNGIFLERGGLGSEAVAIWMAVQDLLREVGDGSNRG